MAYYASHSVVVWLYSQMIGARYINSGHTSDPPLADKKTGKVAAEPVVDMDNT